MKKFIFIVAVLFSICNQSFSQNWIYDLSPATYSMSPTSADGITHMKIKGGFIYVTGYSHDGSTNAIVTIKYNSNLQQVWRLPAVYSTSNSLTPNGIDVDNAGNVFVTGTQSNGADNDIIILGYNSDGSIRSGWPVIYNGGGNDEAGAIGVDDNSNIYVTGGSLDTRRAPYYFKITTLSYNSNGVIRTGWPNWFVNPFFPNNPDGKAWAISVDNSTITPTHPQNGIYVAGWYRNVDPNNNDWLHDAEIVHYNFDGSFSDPQGYDEVHYGCATPLLGEDWANAVIASPIGDVYATGTKWCAEEPFLTYQHEFFTFRSYWVKNPDGSGWHYKLDDFEGSYCDNSRYWTLGTPNPAENGGNAIALDNQNFAYSTGHIQKQFRNGILIDQDYGTFKYDFNGNKVWMGDFDSSPPTVQVNDFARSITIIGNQIFVTGMAGDSGSSNIVTIEYSASTGSPVCLANFDGSSQIGDRGAAIGTDGTFIYVAGVTNELATSSNHSDFILLRYTPNNCQNGDKNPHQNVSNFLTIPQTFELSQNYPNPFNPSTVIKYALPEPANLSMKVYNVLGQKVMDFGVKYLDAGYYSETIDGSNLASGIYIYAIEAKDAKNNNVIFTTAKKMLLIK